MKEKIKEFNKQKDTLYAEVKEYVQNTDLPLDDRWDVFVWSGFGDCSDWVVNGFKPLDDHFGREVCWYDDFHIDKYQTLEMKDLVEFMEEREGSYPELIDALKEEILAKFLFSFVNDW